MKKTLALAAMAAAVATPATAKETDTRSETWSERARIPMLDLWAERSEAPAFHADWTPEERVLLLHMRNHLKNDFMKETLQQADEFWDAIRDAIREAGFGFANRRDRQVEWLDCAKIRFEWLCMLDRVITGGYAVLPTAGCRFQFEYYTIVDNPQRVAAYLGEYEAMKMLILRGADPNALYRSLDEKGEDSLAPESALASVIANVKRGGYAERMEIAEWLLAHGASFDVLHEEWHIHMCCGAWADPERQRPEIFEWGLSKGAPLTMGMVCSILDTEGTLPLLQRLLEEGRLDPKNPPDGRCLLVYVCDHPGRLEAVEKARLLLEAGAPVEGVEPQRKEGESDEDWEERADNWKTPIQEVQLGLEITGPEELKDDYYRQCWENSLQLLELLILHGAEASLDEDDLPEDPAMAEQVRETIHRAMQSRNKE